eukprot:CAMPEP_0198123322 /NCGR_PEP_ID=MMETSP1442-20131203/37231_1 /TAXON_ID= /ORGANISM="Craspedostauros australis, Strain CCMP3328" /LENGTH=316 /DNA_ID=CAMNT_0043782515 /DNA_START=327 /DNA_END=1274 /DNA_ORIENTATION=-
MYVLEARQRRYITHPIAFTSDGTVAAICSPACVVDTAPVLSSLISIAVVVVLVVVLLRAARNATSKARDGDGQRRSLVRQPGRAVQALVLCIMHHALPLLDLSVFYDLRVSPCSGSDAAAGLALVVVVILGHDSVVDVLDEEDVRVDEESVEEDGEDSCVEHGEGHVDGAGSHQVLVVDDGAVDGRCVAQNAHYANHVEPRVDDIHVDVFSIILRLGNVFDQTAEGVGAAEADHAEHQHDDVHDDGRTAHIAATAAARVALLHGVGVGISASWDDEDCFVDGVRHDVDCFLLLGVLGGGSGVLFEMAQGDRKAGLR